MRVVRLEAGERLSASDLHKAGALPREVRKAAEDICDDVRERGDEALREYALRFDGICPGSFLVPREALDTALAFVGDEYVASLRHAHAQIWEYHEKQLMKSWTYRRNNKTELGVKITPIASVALYVPGGRAQYPSTVLMDSVPAKVAGVERLIMLTPPQKDGSISSYTLAAAAVAGVDEVYAVGGAQAIAAAAYGTESIPAVDKIVGPGNAYVAAAKNYVFGDVGIDMIAGPSEVCVFADASANSAVVAADLMAQAEHDPMAACYLVSCDASLADKVNAALERYLRVSPRAEITEQSLTNEGLIVVCENVDDAFEVINTLAPEHLELYAEDADELLNKVKNAGATFVGAWSSEPLGDYVAGPNHTLPTGGTARFSNPLGTYDFQKRTSVIRYEKEGLLEDGPVVQDLAQSEGLWAHALSVGLRLKLAQGDALDGSDEEIFHTAWPRDLSLDEDG